LKLEFRQADAADIAAMSVIRLAVTENPLRDPSRITHAMYVDYLERLGRSWVCEADGVIAGFACADKHNASVWALFVSPDREGLGIGRQLLAMLGDYLFSLGHAQIVLGTSVGTRADAFYAAQGWERGRMIDAVEVQYTLRKPREYSHVHPA
jgi:GNAT superfamily N-acetyltransferase